MVNNGLCVKDFMVLRPLFIYKEGSLYDAIEIMKFYNSENLAVVDEDLIILGVITKNQIIRELNYEIKLKNLKNKTVYDVIENNNTLIVIYAGTSINEAYSMMKSLGIKGLPVADLPWDKKIKGYLWLADIVNELEKNKLNFVKKIQIYLSAAVTFLLDFSQCQFN
ncbi:MAG: CBS domain-containing protein [Candidatus Gastranaerophilaceae bacterium]|jgi:predicted transcriptional regulator